MKYEVKGGSFPVVECRLEDGEKMITESGSMVWMSPEYADGDHRRRNGKNVFQSTFR